MKRCTLCNSWQEWSEEKQAYQNPIDKCVSGAAHNFIDWCTDCGTKPSHEDSPPGYCRYCSIKAGHDYAFYTKVDNDQGSASDRDRFGLCIESGAEPAVLA